MEKINPLCMVNACFFSSNPLFASAKKFQFPHLILSFFHELDWLFRSLFWFLLTSPNQFERSKSFWKQHQLYHCQFRFLQNLFCLKRRRDVSTLFVCTSTPYQSPSELLPFYDSSWQWLRIISSGAKKYCSD